jgi:hypothetical protein
VIRMTISSPRMALVTEPRPPPQADSAEHRSSEDGHLHATTGIRSGIGQPRREKDGGARSQDTGGDVGQCDDPFDVDAGVVGRTPAAADGADVPAGTRAGDKDVAENRHGCKNPALHRKAQRLAAADPVPGRGLRGCRRDVHQIDQRQHVEGRPVNDERDQGGEEGAQAEVADQNAVDAAQQPAEQQGGEDRGRHRPFEQLNEIKRAQRAQREHRSHRQVDPAGHEHDGHGKHDETQFTRLANGVDDTRHRDEVLDVGIEKNNGDQQKQYGHHRFCPALGKQLSNDMVWPEPVSQLDE